IGSLLMVQEQYAEARQHFEEGRSRYKSLGNQLYEGYALMNLGAAFWKLGSYDESSKMLQQASEIAKEKAGSFLALQAAIDLVEAEISLSDRKFAEAGAKAKQALDLTGAENKGVVVEANNLMGLSQALSGRAAAGLALCQQVSDTVVSLTDPLLRAKSQLA